MSSSTKSKKLKKGSFYKKKQNSKEDDEPETVSSGAVDPVYSLLKCAQEMPKSSGGKSPCMVHPHCSGHHSGEQRYMRYPSGGDSSGNTSKTSSPSSSGPSPSPLTSKLSKKGPGKGYRWEEAATNY